MSAVPTLLVVSFTGQCDSAVAAHFDSTIKPYVQSRGGSASLHVLSDANPLPSLTSYNQVRCFYFAVVVPSLGVVLLTDAPPVFPSLSQLWVIDLSSNTDNYPTAFTAIAAWFSSGPQMHLIADARFAASTMRTSSVCYPDLTGSNNDALLRSYLDRLLENGGGLLLGVDYFTSGMDQLCDALQIDRFASTYVQEEQYTTTADFHTGTLASVTTEHANKLTLDPIIRTPCVVAAFFIYLLI